MKFRGGEFSTGTTGNFHSELTRRHHRSPVGHAGQPEHHQMYASTNVRQTLDTTRAHGWGRYPVRQA